MNIKLALPLLSLASFVGACCAEPPPGLDDNHFPVARLVLPQLAVTGDSVDVDASASSDEDGGVLSFVYGFGDGSGEAIANDDDVFSHVFADPGTYTVTVTVADEEAFEASTELQIVVVDGEDEGCSCDLPCQDAGVCTDRGCLVQSSSVEEDAVEFDDVVACGG